MFFCQLRRLENNAVFFSCHKQFSAFFDVETFSDIFRNHDLSFFSHVNNTSHTGRKFLQEYKPFDCVGFALKVGLVAMFECENQLFGVKQSVTWDFLCKADCVGLSTAIIWTRIFLSALPFFSTHVLKAQFDHI